MSNAVCAPALVVTAIVGTALIALPNAFVFLMALGALKPSIVKPVAPVVTVGRGLNRLMLPPTPNTIVHGAAHVPAFAPAIPPRHQPADVLPLVLSATFVTVNVPPPTLIA